MSNELKATQERLAALEAEDETNRARLDDLTREMMRIHERQKELNGGFWDRGLIGQARLAVKYAQKPVYRPAAGDEPALRIVAVVPNLCLRSDGEPLTVGVTAEYSAHSGRRIAGFDLGPEEVNPVRVLEIWERYRAEADAIKSTPTGPGAAESDETGHGNAVVAGDDENAKLGVL